MTFQVQLVVVSVPLILHLHLILLHVPTSTHQVILLEENAILMFEVLFVEISVEL